MADSKSRNIFIALSGGVDSATAAALLKEAGHEVTGVFLKVWTPEFGECPWREDRLAAMRCAASLDIPFQEVDVSDAYRRTVIENMIEEYRRGHTPNPDVLCNRAIKFGALWEYARARGAECIATGHHARISPLGNPHGNEVPTYGLFRGKDAQKDQTYFLWRLTQDDLAHTLFPVGGMTKSEVRAYARTRRIPSAERPDSQGLCFVGDVDMHTFLKDLLKPERGAIYSLTGRIIGEHDGAALYTLGQRHAFAVTDAEYASTPVYVVGIDTARNSVTVAPDIESAKRRTIYIHDENWIYAAPQSGSRLTGAIRYRAGAAPCTFERDDSYTKILFDEAQLAVPGQSLVLYREDECIGGGIISQELN